MHMASFIVSGIVTRRAQDGSFFFASPILWEPAHVSVGCSVMLATNGVLFRQITCPLLEISGGDKPGAVLSVDTTQRAQVRRCFVGLNPCVFKALRR